MTHYHTPEGVRMSPYDALIQALDVPPHCDPVEWAVALAAHAAGLRRSASGGIAHGAHETAARIIGLREPPPLGPAPHAWTASGLPVTIEHTGVMWSCRVHLPDGHPWHDYCPHSVDGVYGGWACRAAYQQQGHDAARATEGDAVACAAMLAAEARKALA